MEDDSEYKTERMEWRNKKTLALDMYEEAIAEKFTDEIERLKKRIKSLEEGNKVMKEENRNLRVK